MGWGPTLTTHKQVREVIDQFWPQNFDLSFFLFCSLGSAYLWRKFINSKFSTCLYCWNSLLSGDPIIDGRLAGTNSMTVTNGHLDFSGWVKNGLRNLCIFCFQIICCTNIQCVCIFLAGNFGIGSWTKFDIFKRPFQHRQKHNFFHPEPQNQLSAYIFLPVFESAGPQPVIKAVFQTPSPQICQIWPQTQNCQSGQWLSGLAYMWHKLEYRGQAPGLHGCTNPSKLWCIHVGTKRQTCTCMLFLILTGTVPSSSFAFKKTRIICPVQKPECCIAVLSISLFWHRKEMHIWWRAQNKIHLCQTLVQLCFSDRLSDSWVLVSNEKRPDPANPANVCNYIDDVMDIVTVDCNYQGRAPPSRGRYVMIWSVRKTIINFCEVEVQSCPIGTWGPLYSESCTRCASGATCRVSDGSCYQCPRGRVGPDCSCPAGLSEDSTESCIKGSFCVLFRRLTRYGSSFCRPVWSLWEFYISQQNAWLLQRVRESVKILYWFSLNVQSLMLDPVTLHWSSEWPEGWQLFSFWWSQCPPFSAKGEDSEPRSGVI